MKFDNLLPGESVFIDANIFLYYLLAKSQECKALLLRCASRELRGITASFVIAEVTHRLMTIEAVSRGLVSTRLVVKKLNQNPEIVKQLLLPGNCLEQIEAMNIQIMPLDANLLRYAATVRSEFGLLTNDSLVAAGMRQSGLTNLATTDRGFNSVHGLRIFSPGDFLPSHQ